MNKLVDFLNNNPSGQFATIKDGRPTMRPFQFIFERNNKLYFMTSNQKDVYKQLKQYGVAGFAVMGKKMSWARLSGEVEFVDDIELKKEVFAISPLVRQVYKTPDNPVLEMFYIHNGEANLYLGLGDVSEKIKI